jgi:hypothetical protein
MGLSKLFPFSWMLSKEMVIPYCIKSAQIPCTEASHSTIKVFVNTRISWIGVIHIANLRFSKALFSSLIQENASFFNNVARGVSISPQFLTKLW